MKNTKGEVWVFAEQEEGKLSDVPFELLGKARELAGKLGVKVGAVLMGEGVEPLSGALFEAGADVVHMIDDAALKVYRNKAYRHAMVELVKGVIANEGVGAVHGLFCRGGHIPCYVEVLNRDEESRLLNPSSPLCAFH